MRITEQYFWNFILGLFFFILTIMGAIILETEARIPWYEMTVFDMALITLATWRLTNLLTNDHHTKWFREQFLDIKKVGKGYVLEKPRRGVRRVFADLLDSPWRSSLVVAGVVVFLFQITTYTYYILFLAAISALVIFLQLFTERLIRPHHDGYPGE